MASSTVNTFFQLQDGINTLTTTKADCIQLYFAASGATGKVTIPYSSFMIFTTRTNGTGTGPAGLYVGSAYVANDGTKQGYLYAIKESTGVTLSISGKELSYTTSTTNMHINIIYMENATSV